MASCAVFGHRNEFYYSGKEEKIYSVINDLVESRGVTEFYNGYRGEFDEICADYVYWLKKHGFPEIKNILVLAYLRNNKFDKFVLPYLFDESEYLLDKYVPPHAAIIETNKRLALKADYILSGVDSECWKCGGAYIAVEYGRKHGKTIISIFS